MAFIHIGPANVLADVCRQGVQEALGTDFIAHRADLADIVLYAVQNTKAVHDHLLFSDGDTIAHPS